MEMLERLGFKSHHYRAYYAKNRTEVERAFLRSAQDYPRGGEEIEVDDDAEVSLASDEGGAYVQAWIWVP